MSQPAAEEPEDESGISDDRLRLMFTCCHPALSMEARAALTLRSVAGLTTAEIARAFLVTEQTMAKRLVRAKSKIQTAGIPYRVPPRELLDERTSGVLAVLYLLFSEGYASTGEQFLRDNLCAEAIRLARLLVELMPDQAEAQGLLTLLLLQHSRRRARVDDAGVLVPLELQDRDLWDAPEIDEAIALLEQTDPQGHGGAYQLQATIAACHATARTPADTDWPAIATLYGRLTMLAPSPIVSLNHAVACGMADGPGVGLTLLAEIEDSGALSGYYLVPATRADLLRRLGRFAEAAASYREALPLAPADAERRYLCERLASVEASLPE
jgi:RNA polymerase sigma-70 factor (ECF subfamily)